MKRPYGRTLTGHTVPYGTLVNASKELLSAYYNYGYLRDEDMPELPCIPMMEGEHVDPIEELYKKDVIRLIEEVLDDVTPRQEKVLRLRFGIGVAQEHTLEEIGCMFDLSKTRIGQIEGKAIRDIKHPARSYKLKQLIPFATWRNT